MEDVNKGRRISFSLSKLECGPQEINSREICLHLPFSANWNKRDSVWKTGIHFKSDVFTAVAVVDAKGSFSNDDGDGSENIKKAIGLISKTTTLHVHAFFYISLPSLHKYGVIIPYFTFCGERKQATKNFFFSSKTWVLSPRNQLQGNSPTFHILRELE